MPYISLSRPQASTCHLHLAPSSHLPTHPVLPGCYRAQALGSPCQTSSLHCSSVSRMVKYMFQCYSLKSSHPLLLPLSPKVCSLCLCLLCCPACRTVSIIILDSINSVHSVMSDQLFVTPWTATHQASLSITNSQNLLKLMFIESVMPSSCVVPFSSHLQSFPAFGSFPMSQFFASGGQSIGVSASASVLPMNIQY